MGRWARGTHHIGATSQTPFFFSRTHPSLPAPPPPQDAWETGVRQRLRVCDSDQEVGFSHCYQDGVDYVFIDHHQFLNFGGGF